MGKPGRDLGLSPAELDRIEAEREERRKGQTPPSKSAVAPEPAPQSS